MRMHVDITARSGTTSLESTTWDSKKASNNTRRDTKSNEQGDVDSYRGLHISFHLRLRHSDIEWAKSQTDIGY